MAELPSRVPYLLRAHYEWLVDAGCTPHLLVDATVPGVQVPAPYVRDGRIVLNISPSAVRDLRLDNQIIEFSARFGGTPYRVRLPVNAVLALYARENGEGIAFSASAVPADEERSQPPPGAAAPLSSSVASSSEAPSNPPPNHPGRPILKRVK